MYTYNIFPFRLGPTNPKYLMLNRKIRLDYIKHRFCFVLGIKYF